MSFPIFQYPSIILPTIAPLGTETETIGDLVTHVSIEVPTNYFQEKTFHILATEVVAFGVPGSLNAWVELSPYPSTVVDDYWAAIGGGGGALAPVAPTVIIATGVHGTVHTFMIPWTIHAPYARLVIQTPIAASLPTALWIVQAMISAKGT